MVALRRDSGYERPPAAGAIGDLWQKPTDPHASTSNRKSNQFDPV
jgi:hypothetical protein